MGRVASSALGHPLCLKAVSPGENIYISWAVVIGLAIWSGAWKEKDWKVGAQQCGVEACGWTHGSGHEL